MPSSLVWSGIFSDYRNALSQSTEACDEYHYACLLSIAGAMFGRSVAIQYGLTIYPNFFTVLVGETALARKTTAMRYGEKLLQGVNTMKIRWGVSSAEGLVSALGGFIDVAGVTPRTGPPVMLMVEEYATMLRKARQDSSSNLPPMITALFDMPPRVDLPRVSNPMVCLEPSLSILSGTTPEWLENSVKEEEIMGGFSNRFVYFTGKPKPPMAFPNSPDKAALEMIKDRLVDARDYWKIKGNAVMKLNKDAMRLWEAFYVTWHSKKRPEIVQTVGERLPVYALKTALIYAAIEKKSEIGPDELTAGIKLSEYLEGSLYEIFGFFAFTEGGRLERKVFQILSKTNPITRWQLHQKLSGRVSARDLNMVLVGLADNGRIYLYADSGKPMVKLRRGP